MPLPAQRAEVEASAQSVPDAYNADPTFDPDVLDHGAAVKRAKAAAVGNNNSSGNCISIYSGSELRDNGSTVEMRAASDTALDSAGLRSSPTGSGGPGGVTNAGNEGADRISDIRGRGPGLAAARVAAAGGKIPMSADSNAGEYREPSSDVAM